MRAMRWFVLTLLFLGCPPAASPVAASDAGTLVGGAMDAGPLVTEARLAAWLKWQAELAALPALSRTDGGPGPTELRARARQEAMLLADAGLSGDQADAIEAVVAAVVAERNVARITGADALQQFREGMAHLSVEQRVKAEAALAATQIKTSQGSLKQVEEMHGAEAVRVVLTREAEVTKTWDALLEARGDKK